MDAGEFGMDDREAVLTLLERVNSVLGVLPRDEESIDPALVTEIEGMIEQRKTARRDRDFKKADQIRNELADRGIILEDTPQGTKWKRK
jgi:cysteinyl-tRNA synthetase